MAKILLVEDDQMNLDMLSRHLLWEGHEVITAVDGADAVRLARLELPDVILMDMGLPILSGWQATQSIRTTPETSAIPIIALTAYAMAEDRLQCLAAGCDEYQTKPVNFPQLLTKIQTLASKKSN
jgi:two-component system, cell cycle response regulator DivK